ncbi:uncharacterized protein LY79DRAFT_662053 [Colletotrichum navitas]|uniref:Uncharacterized protein n=1 Tax=Colletotrichum navitas TaxID=681940 RepID=A0AAD8V0U5_9PEZI|nr:uncharacterized protein LY79DRAFT_662053 [Colletotrichum navitas]KAK1574678.1 hypothetical protein LY79DRAFT_662053 [Colletotrichum navitas]
MAQLGWQFLASAYLQVNLDAGQFSLWAANPTSAEDIAAMDSEDEVMDDFCAVTSNNGDIDGAGNSSSSPGTSPSQLPTLSPGSAEAAGPALPTGAIVGVAVGAVVAGAVFGGLVLWFCKRKKGVSPGIRTQTGQVEGPSVAYQDKPPIYGGWSYKPELSGQTSQPHELANEGSGPRPGHQYELAG